MRWPDVMARNHTQILEADRRSGRSRIVKGHHNLTTQNGLTGEIQRHIMNPTRLVASLASTMTLSPVRQVSLHVFKSGADELYQRYRADEELLQVVRT